MQGSATAFSFARKLSCAIYSSRCESNPLMPRPLMFSKSGDAAAIVPRIGAEMLLVRPLAKKKGLYQGLCPLHYTLDSAMQQKPPFIIYDQIGSHEHPIGKDADRLRRRVPV